MGEVVTLVTTAKILLPDSSSKDFTQLPKGGIEGKLRSSGSRHCATNSVVLVSITSPMCVPSSFLLSNVQGLTIEFDFFF